MELIDRRKRWLDVVGHVSSEEDEDKAAEKQQSNLPAWQWDETIKGNPLEDKAISDELERQEKERKEAKEAQEKRAKERVAGGGPKSPKPPVVKKQAEKPAEKQPEKAPAVAATPAGQEVKKKVSEKKKAPAAAPAKKAGEKPSALTSVIHPALSKLSKTSKDENVHKALEELREAFDAAESTQPGIVHNFIAQIIETLKSAS